MATGEEIVKDIQAVLEVDPRINMHRNPTISVHFVDDEVVVEGEAENILVKRLAIRLARAVASPIYVQDRLFVKLADTMGDATIRDHVSAAIMGESVFTYHGVRVWDNGKWQVRRESRETPTEQIDLRVEDGVVTLTGTVISLSHKRLASALAWWVPGTREVLNRLGLNPPEDDNDDEVTDAVRLVLEKDPLINASQLGITTQDYVVTLLGSVAKDREKELAEHDVWYVDGVRGVDNRIIVAPTSI
jgi:osmotically-inducible protein OsmY